jgi:hypothetical protein
LQCIDVRKYTLDRLQALIHGTERSFALQDRIQASFALSTVLRSVAVISIARFFVTPWPCLFKFERTDRTGGQGRFRSLRYMQFLSYLWMSAMSLIYYYVFY